jgi:hypothetical protein
VVRRLAALLLLLASIGADAAEVIVTLQNGKLGARVDAIAFPGTLPKELGSGLTNRIYARVSVMDAQQILDRRAVEVAIRFDLWDEKFAVVSAMNGATEARLLENAKQVDSLLAALPLPGLFDAAALPATRELVLRVEVLLNPIDREKMRMIRKWVTQNSTPEIGGDEGISVSNGIFNRIFEQYAEDSDVAAVWRTAVDSKPFRLDGLVNETR